MVCSDVYASSMLCWWPRLKGRVRAPETVLVPLYGLEGLVDAAILEERPPAGQLAELGRRLVNALSVVRPPVFIRTDQSSCKHWLFDGPPVASNAAEALTKALLVLQCHEPFDQRLFGPPRPRALAVREVLIPEKWLDAERYKLRWFQGNIEVRVVVKEGRIEAIYPYYHIAGFEEYEYDVMEEHGDEIRRAYHERYVATIVKTIDDLLRQAEAAAKALGRDCNWSIDLMYARRRGEETPKWYVIDAALLEASWLPPRTTEEDEMIAEAAGLSS